jgi:flagellar assembly factor FliW
MPQLETHHFGLVEYAEDATFDFPAGVPGFEAERRFLFVEQPQSRPLVFMQSISTAGLCFITVPVQVVMPEYQLDLSPEDTRVLQLPDGCRLRLGSELLCLAIVSVEENQSPTANLLSPVVVSLQSRRGLQAIQADSAYSHRHPFPAHQGDQPCS